MNLTNPELHKIRTFNEDKLMSETIKKVLLSVTEVDYSELADQTPLNDVLGSKIRALAEGQAFIEEGFSKLLEFEKVEATSNKINPAL